MAPDYMSRRQVLQAAAALTTVASVPGLNPASAVGLYAANTPKKDKRYIISYSIGMVGISLTAGLSKENADYWLDIAAECLQPDGVHKDPAFEILIAPNPDLDLTDPKQGYLKQFEYLGPKLKDRHLKPVGLIFIPGDEYGNMVSRDKTKRILAQRQAMAGVDIVKMLDGDLITGPWWFGHKIFDDVNIEGAYDHIKRVAEYAAKREVKASAEPLRKEEGPINTLDQAGTIVRAVNHPNFWIQYDSAHGLLGDGPNLRRNTRKALETKMAHKHISRPGKWMIDPDNRGVLRPGGPVYDQLPGVMKDLAEEGYDGSLSIEVPCNDFWGAVGRPDPDELAGKSQVLKDANAIESTRACAAVLLRNRDALEEKLTKMS